MCTETAKHETVTVHVDGVAIDVGAHIAVAAALVVADVLRTRQSVSGEARFALCGMGVCQECRVTINGVPHRLACQTGCAPGMRIETK